jgi:uncharacterized protein involved in exopolysaccharide biosynthesis
MRLKGYRQADNLRRAPWVVATVLLIVFSGFAYLLVTT